MHSLEKYRRVKVEKVKLIRKEVGIKLNNENGFSSTNRKGKDNTKARGSKGAGGKKRELGRNFKKEFFEISEANGHKSP